ncbi:MAG: hypothetical protein ACOYNS_07710 [Bacteroidota bacterium]
MRSIVLLFMTVTIGLSQQREPRQIASERENTPSIFGGMGVHVVSAADIVGYINATTTQSQRVDDFGTAVDFFGGIDIPVGSDWGIAIEHSYLFKTYTVPGNLGGVYDLYYSIQAPSILLQKVMKGKGYFVKFSGGGGYHFGSMTQKVSTFGVTTEYTARGIGIVFDAVAQTAFGEDLYGYIGGTTGSGFLGTLKEGNGNSLKMPRTGAEVSLNYFHAGIRFGIVQYF